MPISPYLLLMFSALFWSGNFVLGRAIHTEIPPTTLTFWRWLVALLILLPFAIRPLWAQAHIIAERFWRLALLAVLGVACFNTFLYIGLQTTTATNALLINSTTPLIIIALSRLIFAQRISIRQGAGIILSVVGVGYLIVQGSFDTLLKLSFNWGDLWIVASSTVWALYSVLLRWKPAALEPIPFLAFNMLVGLAVLSLIYILNPLQEPALAPTLSNLISIGYVALFASILAFICWVEGVKAVGANTAGQFIHLMPLFGIALALVFLGERLQVFHFIGAALIALGLYMPLLSRGKANEQRV